MKVITGIGENVRDYANSLGHYTKEMGVGFIKFPENCMDANEQASYMKDLADTNITVITLSSWIVSDTDRHSLYIVQDDLTIVPYEGDNLFGASVNKISMTLWRGKTISDRTLDIMAAIRKELPEVTDTLALKNKCRVLGDSVEKVLLFKTILAHEGKLEGTQHER